MPGYLVEWYQPTMTHERLEQAAYWLSRPLQNRRPKAAVRHPRDLVHARLRGRLLPIRSRIADL